MKHSNKIALGLMLLFLTACGTPLQAPPPLTLKQRPDPAWTQPIPEPKPLGRDNAALAAWAKAMREALATANANLAAIHEWAEKP